MKKLAYLATALIAICALSLTGCKEDGTPPKITITGDAHIMHPKGSPYHDLGATATDNKDESVYVIDDVSYLDPKHPEIDVVGDYTITYTAQDRSGNISTATRVVSVTHTEWQLDHTYNVNDIDLNDTTMNWSYQSWVVPSLDSTNIYRTYFANVMDGYAFTGPTYMDAVGNHITIPHQKPDGAWSPYTIEGTGTISEVAGVITIDIFYTFDDETDSLVTLNRHATFVY